MVRDVEFEVNEVRLAVLVRRVSWRVCSRGRTGRFRVDKVCRVLLASMVWVSMSVPGWAAFKIVKPGREGIWSRSGRVGREETRFVMEKISKIGRGVYGNMIVR